MSDIEGDDLLQGITKIWCASFRELDAHMNDVGKPFTLTGMEEMMKFFSNPDHIVVMHNGIAYDKPAIEKVLKIKV